MNRISTILDVVCLTAQLLLESGGETYRAEESVERMCKGLHISQVDVVALPTTLMLTITDAQGEPHTRIVRVRRKTTDLMRIDECNRVSRKVSTGQMSIEQALGELKRIRDLPLQRNWVLVLASAISAGSFTLMLGGSLNDFLIALLCGALLQWIQLPLSHYHIPSMLQGLLSGALVCFFALLGALILPGADVEPIIGGSIMPLLPGLATTNAIRDTLRGDTISGSSRIMEALLCVITLTAGIGFMLTIWGGIGT